MTKRFVPVIGITVPSTSIQYAIEHAGGEADEIQAGDDVHEWLQSCDGFVIPGGLDVNPQMYDSEPHPLTSADPKMRRDLWERYVIRWAIEQRRPLLGICRGHQLLNVALGGGLIQHISKHWGGIHGMRIVSDEWQRITKIGVSHYTVNSIHHQCVDPLHLGSGLVIAGMVAGIPGTPGGVVEAIVAPRHRFVVGIQSHPEMAYRHDEHAAQLFRSLVEAATPKKILADRRRRREKRVMPLQNLSRAPRSSPASAHHAMIALNATVK